MIYRQCFCLIIKQKARWLVGIIVVKVFSVTPTWTHVAGYISIVDTGSYFPDGDRLTFSGGSEFRGLQRVEVCVGTMLTHQLVSMTAN